jgi:putative membrane protein
MNKKKYPVYLFWIYIIFWIFLAINPVNRFNWFLENILPFIFVPLLVWSHYKFRISNTSYTFIFVFMCIHAIGSHYTYSETPFLSEFMGVKFQRDHFDRLAHFSFGLLVVFPLRELLMKLAGIKGKWSYILPWNIIVSFSAIYEIIEWGVASIVAPHYAKAFLGVQGDEWDAHKDMLLAALGASITMAAAYFKSNKKNK